jgi:hypothetical protein
LIIFRSEIERILDLMRKHCEELTKNYIGRKERGAIGRRLRKRG